ncbi:hypothetical protein [Stenotrophomonas sp. AB1(2024)]|uniref:hypothetical protein n=1 Tax=Stenotrophomonas sp. AB1(2024) TaxID=3132215 RepID=UPI0030A0E0B7
MGKERTPAAEVIQLTAAVWLEAVTEGRQFDQEQDAPRFRKGFAVLCRESATWPQPGDLLKAMPPRGQLTLTKQPIPADPDSPEMKKKFDQIAKLFKPSARRHDNSHGHVTPRADGIRARCGGPGICDVCNKELQSLKATAQARAVGAIP